MLLHYLRHNSQHHLSSLHTLLPHPAILFPTECPMFSKQMELKKQAVGIGLGAPQTYTGKFSFTDL